MVLRFGARKAVDPGDAVSHYTPAEKEYWGTAMGLQENMSTELGYQVFFRQGGYLMITESEDDLPALNR